MEEDELGADAHGNVIEKGLSEGLLMRFHLVLGQVRPNQPYTAINIKTYSNNKQIDRMPFNPPGRRPEKSEEKTCP